MKSDLKKAKELLENENLTCAVIFGEHEYKSRENGVKPLLFAINQGKDFACASAADRVCGRAAAFLYAKLGVKRLYSGTLSKPAAAVLEKYGIEYSYTELVDYIKNRDGSGMCPMENAVLEINDADKALVAIKDTVSKLMANKGN